MTYTVMLAKLRTLLNEASASFWSDTELYASLTDGQQEVANYLVALWKSKGGDLPEALKKLFDTDTGTGTKTLETDFWIPLTVYTSTLPVLIREDGDEKSTLKYNTYTSSSATQPYCYINATQIVLETSVTWTMEYLKAVTAIDGSTNPILTADTHETVVQFAFAEMLKKDNDPRAEAEFQKYLTMVRGLL
ncbi:hypothetical protein ACFLTH_15325 [Bacteroidota bacterium]